MNNLLTIMQTTRPTKYSVKKLAVQSVKQKNLFEVRRFSVGVSYFSVAMNNNFRNILSALNFALACLWHWFFCFKTKEQCNNVSTPFYLRGFISIKSKIPLTGRKVHYISHYIINDHISGITKLFVNQKLGVI